MHSKKEVIVAAIDTGKRWSKSGMYNENEEVIRLQTSTSAQIASGNNFDNSVPNCPLHPVIRYIF